MHDEATPGSSFDLHGPFNSFPLSRNRATYRLIAGGIGITPLVSMAHQLGMRGVPFELHYIVRTADRLVLLDELRSIPCARISLHVSATSGHADLAAIVGVYTNDAEVYACGPMLLLQGIQVIATGSLASCRSSLRKLWSAAGAHRWATSGGVGTIAEIISVRPPTSILDALLAADVLVSYECKRRERASCYTQLVSGKPLHRDVCLTESQRGLEMCTCVSWRDGESLVLDL